MEADIAKFVLEAKRTKVTKICKAAGKSKYTVYKTLKEMNGLSVISKKGVSIEVIESPITYLFLKLLSEGFPMEYFSQKNIETLLHLTDEKSVYELANELGVPLSTAYARVKNVLSLLTVSRNRYKISKSQKELSEILHLLRMQKELKENIIWKLGEEELIRVQKGKPVEGVPTGFSVFSYHGVEIHPRYDFYYKPQKKLSIEEKLVHALKFVEDKNECALCIIFYLKNREKMDIGEIEKTAKKIGVVDLWLDVQSYVERENVKNRELFLPYSEFIEKAKVYGVNLPYKYEYETIDKLIFGLGRKLRESTYIYLVGGGALLLKKIKTATKDMDIIVEDKKTFENIVEALRKIGYEEKKLPVSYNKEEAGIILEKSDFPRVDIFIKKICNISFSNRMKNRSELFKKIENLHLYLVSLEDIFLLKSFSSREGDLIDCINILKKGKINWDIIFEEFVEQQRKSEVFRGFILLEHLEIIERRMEVKIPITKKVRSICLEKGIEMATEKPRTVKEIIEVVNFPEYIIRNKLKKLLREKKIKKIDGKPLRFSIVNKYHQKKHFTRPILL